MAKKTEDEKRADKFRRDAKDRQRWESDKERHPRVNRKYERYPSRAMDEEE